MRALPVEVFRHGNYDCTNNGISSRYSELLVICPDGHIKIDENNPPKNLVKIVKRCFGGKNIYHLEPVGSPEGIGWMFGGNFGYTSDSRFSALYEGYGALAIHDRCESKELYNLLSM